MASEDVRTILSNLLKRREDIRAEAAALDNLIEVYKRLSSDNSPESQRPTDQLELYQSANRRTARAAEISSLMNEARRMIISEQRPMKRGELVKRLIAAGFRIEGTDKNKVFGTNLWRSGKFRMIEGKGYWPKDVVLPK